MDDFQIMRPEDTYRFVKTYNDSVRAVANKIGLPMPRKGSRVFSTGTTTILSGELSQMLMTLMPRPLSMLLKLIWQTRPVGTCRPLTLTLARLKLISSGGIERIGCMAQAIALHYTLNLEIVKLEIDSPNCVVLITTIAIEPEIL
jgi:hypothetical protein